MAYDARRHVTVLYGYRETWEWDGKHWALRSDIGPAVEYTYVMAYDTARGVTVLFRSHDGFRFVGDTWEWDGTTWTLFSEIGPAPRVFSAMAFDSTRGVTVLFGGVRAVGFSTPLNDIWELPSCPIDSDGDGVPDVDDACPNSDLAGTVVIDGCDSGVANQLLDGGCTMADRIAGCAADAGNHGNFVSCVAQLTHNWVDEGVITPRDKGPIQRCAGQADVPQPHLNGRNRSKGESAAPTETLRRR